MPSSRQSSRKNTITTEDAVDALRRSGYLLETRIARKLDRFATHLSMNAVFTDPETGQARELDAYCFRAETSDLHEFFEASAHLLIECVNSPQPIAFFSSTRKPSIYPLTASRPAWLGLYPIEESIGIEDFHHCFKTRISTNYCTFVSKKTGEWMVTHADDQHREFSTLAVLAQLMREKQVQLLDEYSRPMDAVQFCGIESIYPVLVVEGTLFTVTQNTRGEVKLEEIDHVRYLKGQIWKGTRRHCPIDVVTERFFPKLLKLIELDCKRTLARMEKRYDEILEAARNDKEDTVRQPGEIEDFLP
jgi:hypothetical protein